MNTITSQQVSDFLREQLEKCIAICPRDSTQFEAVIHNYRGGEFTIRFQAYNATVGHANPADTAEEAIADMAKLVGNYSPKAKAEQLRRDAAEMIKLAEKLES